MTRLFDPDEDTAWLAEAACRGCYGVMHPERGAPLTAARAICAACPVTAECLDYALRHNEQSGVWGGTSERERRKLRKLRGRQPKELNPLLCGSDSGYHQHYRLGDKPCDRCREAHTLYQQHRRGGRSEEGAA